MSTIFLHTPTSFARCILLHIHASRSSIVEHQHHQQHNRTNSMGGKNHTEIIPNTRDEPCVAATETSTWSRFSAKPMGTIVRLQNPTRIKGAHYYCSFHSCYSMVGIRTLNCTVDSFVDLPNRRRVDGANFTYNYMRI